MIPKTVRDPLQKEAPWFRQRIQFASYSFETGRRESFKFAAPDTHRLACLLERGRKLGCVITDAARLRRELGGNDVPGRQ